MPRTPWTVTNDLAIEVEDFKARYVPGDIICGHVVRRNHLDHRPRSVQLVVFGRVKSKFVSTRPSSGHKCKRPHMYTHSHVLIWTPEK